MGVFLHSGCAHSSGKGYCAPTCLSVIDVLSAMGAISTGSVLVREIQDACPASRTECHGKDSDETLYAPFRLDIEVARADRAADNGSFWHRTRASLKINPRQLWLWPGSCSRSRLVTCPCREEIICSSSRMNLAIVCRLIPSACAHWTMSSGISTTNFIRRRVLQIR